MSSHNQPYTRELHVSGVTGTVMVMVGKSGYMPIKIEVWRRKQQP